MQKHELFEVETAGVSLGTKYYGNDKTAIFAEAEEKNATYSNVEGIQKVSGSSERKLEKVEIRKEQAEKKAEKKQKVEFISSTGFYDF